MSCRTDLRPGKPPRTQVAYGRLVALALFPEDSLGPAHDLVRLVPELLEAPQHLPDPPGNPVSGPL